MQYAKCLPASSTFIRAGIKIASNDGIGATLKAENCLNYRTAPKPNTKVAITGAFSYSGRYITELLQRDTNIKEIRNLTNHPNRNIGKSNHLSQELDGGLDKNQIKVYPLQFDNHYDLVQSLEGIDVLYCTFWTRFLEDSNPEEQHPALAKVKRLVDAAAEAKVSRLIYISHTQPDPSSEVKYIQGKALAEEYIRTKMPSYGFIRPCCLFGDSPDESIVVNNTAYLMRRLPLMIFPGNPNEVHFQPVHVRDLAEMAVDLANATDELDGSSPNIALDAVGPEKLKFSEFVGLIRKNLNLWCWVMPTFSNLTGGLPVGLVSRLTSPINYLLDDTFVDAEDLSILVSDIACSELNPLEGSSVWGKRLFSEWLKENKDELGRSYINSYQRYYDVKT